MSTITKTLCVSTLLSILASSASVSAAAPITNQTSAPSTHRSRSPKTFAIPDKDGWLHFDSIGMMLPMDGPTDTFEDQEFDKRALAASGSRDLMKRPALIGRGEDGEVVYQLQEEGDNARTVDRYDGEEDEEFEDADEGDDDWYSGEAGLDKLDSRSLFSPSAFAEALSRRAVRTFTSLVRRKKQTKNKSKGKSSSKSSKGGSKKSKSSKKSSKASKKSSSGSKKASSKASSAMDLSKGLIMKGATLLCVPYKPMFKTRTDLSLLFRTTITWYTGVDLLNPYCDRNSHWTPTDDSLIIAVTQKWSSRPACGEFMEIQTQDKGKKVSSACIPGWRLG